MQVFEKENSRVRLYVSPLGLQNNSLPHGAWEWSLFAFIIGSLSFSYIEGLSKIMILYGVLFSAGFLLYFLYSKLSFRLPPEVVIYYIWILWSLGGLLNSVDSGVYFSQFKRVLQMGVMIFCVSKITSIRKNISVVMLALLIGCIIQAVSGFFTGQFQAATADNTSGRIVGMTGNANEFAYCLVFLIFSLFYFLGDKKTYSPRIILVIGTLLSLMLIIYSGSRKGFLSSLVFILVWVRYCKGVKLPRNPIFAIALILIVSVGGYLFISQIFEHSLLKERFENKRMEHSTDIRVQMYKDGFEMIKNNPIFGVGLDNFKLLSTRGAYSHSDYIEVLSNTGIVGFILYISIYFFLWRRLNWLMKISKDPYLLYIFGLLKSAIIVILIVAFGSPNIVSKLTWIFLASSIGFTWSLEQPLKRWH